MRVTIRLLMLALLGLSAGQLSAGSAQACIRFDRPAEMALIDGAIAAPETPDWNKAVLRALRKEMVVFESKTGSDDVLQYHWLVTDALKRIGKERIVWREPEGADITTIPKSATRQAADSGPARSCG